MNLNMDLPKIANETNVMDMIERRFVKIFLLILDLCYIHRS